MHHSSLKAEKSFDEFRLFVETIPQMVWIGNADDSIEYLNQRWHEYTSSSKEWSQEEDRLRYYHPEDRPEVQSCWQKALQSKQAYEIAARLRNGQTGEYRWFLECATPQRNAQGQVIRWFGTYTDIHDKKLKEEALQMSSGRFRKLFASKFIGIVIGDLPGNLFEANDAFLLMVGYTREDLSDRAFNWRKLAVDKKLYDADMAAIQRYRKAGYMPPIERELARKDGNRIWVSLVSVVLDYINDTVITFVFDIQQKKEIDQRKDDFISMAGHELKTPLAGLKLLSQYVRRKLRKGHLEDTEKYLTQMNTEIDNLTRLVNDLLDVSRMQAGLLMYRDEFFDFDALVSEIITSAQQTCPTHTFSLQGTSGKHYYGDRYRIGEVLSNVFGNAIKYSPLEQKVEISILKRLDGVAVSVRDHGIGISKAEQGKIFERFYRANPQKGGAPGLGIGLYIAQEIVTHYNGEITVESQKGEGATFTVTLPDNEEKTFA